MGRTVRASSCSYDEGSPGPPSALTAPGHCAKGGGKRGPHAGHAQLGRKDSEVVGTRQEAGRHPLRRRVVVSRTGAPMIENLPAKLSVLDDVQLRRARDRRDERMSILFRGWPSLSTSDMRELRRLSDERQRLARHVGILRRLRTLREHSARRGVARGTSALSVPSAESALRDPLQ